LRAALAAVVFLGLIAILAAGATRHFETHGDHDPQTLHHAEILQDFDLAGAMRRDPGFDLGLRREDGGGEFETFLRTLAAPNYRDYGVDNLTALPGARDMMDLPGEQLGQPARAWGRLILHRPLLYLSIRWKVWLNTLLTPPGAACPMIFTGVDGVDGPMMRAAGLKPRESPKDDWDEDYAKAFLTTPLFSHLFYGGLIVLAMALGLRRWVSGERGPELIVSLALALAGAAFAASFFVISIDCDYRFLYFLDVSAMIAIAHEAASRPGVRAAPVHERR
jgi:hypothetical protein